MRFAHCLRILGLLSLLLPLHLLAQRGRTDSIFTQVELRIDTASFSLDEDLMTINGRDYLRFEYTEEAVVAELLLFPYSPYSVKSLKLLSSPDFETYDSLIQVGRSYFRSRIRLNRLSNATSLQIPVQMVRFNGDTTNTVISLFHTADTEVTVPPGNNTLYIGEEVILPLETTLPRNVRPQPTWRRLPSAAYRITVQDQRPQLHLIPLQYGTQRLELPVETLRPRVDPTTGRLEYQTTITPFTIQVKKGAVQFLSLNRDQVYLPRDQRYVEVDVRFPRQFSLSLGKPYRLERSAEGVRPLVGGLMVREIQSGDQMLATLRLYDYHRRSEGPLYLKSQEDVIFLTNLDILPPPAAHQVEIRRGGGEWTTGLTLKPGDEFDLRIKGESLGQARFSLKGLEEVGDPVLKDQEQILTWSGLKIPFDVTSKELVLMQNEEQTPFRIPIREYQRPRTLDFVMVRLGQDSATLNTVPSTIYIPPQENDFFISFRRDSIDKGEALYGLQYLNIIFEVWDKENRRLQERKVHPVVICPGKSSSRHSAYDRSSCFDGVISINDLLDEPLYDLPGWAQVRITIEHQQDKYEEQGRKAPFTLVMKKKIELGLEFSTPTGVLMNRFGSGQNETLNTLNFTALMQFGLYQDRAINRLYPIQLGVGVMAVDVFPFNGDADRDIVLGSFLTFYPINSKQRWNVPLYLGGGYMLGGKTGFFFLGPGLSIRL